MPPGVDAFLDLFQDGDRVVYTACRHGGAQYVGQSSHFPSRFRRGVKDADGYRWFQTKGTYKLDAWKLHAGSGEDLATAVEIEIAMRSRLVIGHWPVELGGLTPYHFSRTNPAIQDAIKIASRITFWLIYQQRFKPTTVAATGITELQLFENFTDGEIDLQRQKK